MTDIEKLKINQTMRKEAVKAAIQFKFKDAVDKYNSKLVKVISTYALNRKANKDAINEYNGLSDNLKKMVRITDKIYLRDKNDARYILPISNNMTYLTYSTNDSYFPFMKNARQGYEYEQMVQLTFAKPMIETTFKFEDKIPSPIQKVFDARKVLMKEIDQFSHDTYHALSQVKTVKQVREYIPALEQFIPIPEKEFTKMVPYSFFNKVNKSINGVK